MTTFQVELSHLLKGTEDVGKMRWFRGFTDDPLEGLSVRVHVRR